MVLKRLILKKIDVKNVKADNRRMKNYPRRVHYKFCMMGYVEMQNHIFNGNLIALVCNFF